MPEYTNSSGGGAGLDAANGQPVAGGGDVNFWGGFSEVFTDLLNTADNTLNTLEHAGLITPNTGPVTTMPAVTVTADRVVPMAVIALAAVVVIVLVTRK